MKIRGGALPPTNVGKAAGVLVEQLKKGDAATPAKGVRDAIDTIAADENLDLRRSELLDAAVLALAQLSEPKAVLDQVIAEVAATLKKTPEEIGDRLKTTVATAVDAIAEQPAVSDAQLSRAMRGPDERLTVPSAEHNRTARPFGQLRDMPPEDYQRVLQDLAAEVKKQWNDQGLNEPVVNYFIKRFEELTGVNVVRADSVAALLRDFGDAFRALFDREMPITLVAGGNPVDQQAVRDLMKGVYDELEARGLTKRVAQVGRFKVGGAHDAAFSVLERAKEVDRIGLASPSKDILTSPTTPMVEKPVLFGKTLGDESWLTRELARRGVAIVLGGDAQSIDEAKDVLARNPSHAIILEGFNGDTKGLAGVPGATYIADAKTKPVEAGRKIGAMIASMIESEHRDLMADPLLKAAFQMSSGQLSDAVNHLQQNAAQNRIVRIITAVGNRLERAGVPSQEIWGEVSRLSSELATRTLGVDNFKDNALWQKLAREAFEATGGKVKQIVDDAMIDVYFASWAGIQKKPEKPSWFEQNTSAMPSEPQRFDYQAPHTMLDLDKYAYIRLDKPIADMLQVAANGTDPTTRPEVFLGSEAEMRAYYAEKGFSTSYNAFDSNGTQYLMFQRGDVVKPVLFGIDSPARLTQVSALLEHAGVDTSKMIVRGKIDDVRSRAQNALETALRALDKPIAGVVVNNTAETAAALAAAAGVSPDDLRTTGTQTVGPFRFDVLEVKAKGTNQAQVILAFKPAYGELTQDLVNATLSVGARNFLMGGAGGSLVPGDAEFGAMHRITQIQYGNQVVDLAKAGLDLMAPIAGVTQDGVTNVFHPSPVLQSQAWADSTRKQFPKSDVDQETAAALFALTEARRARQQGESLRPGDVVVQEQIFVSTMLHQSDVVGRGFLELGTVDKNYTPNVKANVSAWLKELGVGAALSKDGSWHDLAGAQPGRLATQQPKVDVSRVKVPLKDMSSIGASNEYSHIDQFKGQKRCIVIDTHDPSMKDRALLEKTLSRLDQSQYWVVTSQIDPNHGELLKLAEKMGFESLLLTTRAAAQSGDILGTPTFTMFFEDAAAIGKAKKELTTKGTNYEWEENDAQHWHLVVGDAKLTTTPAQNELHTSRMGNERDAQKAGDLIRDELDDKRALVEDGLAGWAKGSYAARDGETIFELSVRFGLTDPRSAYVNALLPALRQLTTEALRRAGKSDDVSKLSVKELAALCTPLAKDAAAQLVLDAIKTKDAWPDNAPVPDKLAGLKSAAGEVEQRAVKLTASTGATALAKAARGARVLDLDNALTALNPGVKSGEALAAGAAVKLREGPARTPPNMISPAFVEEALGGRKPFLITGASAKSWPMMAANDRARIVKMMQVLAKVLDPAKVSIWTGTTAFGVEKYAQQIFAEAGFQLMGIGTENTLKDLKDVAPQLTDVMLLGINWFGKSRPVVKMVEDLGGDVLAVGGGAILLAEIMVSVAMGARTHIMSGIELSGAGVKEQLNQLLKSLDKMLKGHGDKLDANNKSALEAKLNEARALVGGDDPAAMAKVFEELAAQTRAMGEELQKKQVAAPAMPAGIVASSELAPDMKALAFDATAKLLERLGINPSALKPDMLSNNVTADLLQMVVDVSKESASMSRYQTAQARA